MLLSKLKEYADERLEDHPPPPLYANTPVAWIVMLDSDGRPLSPQPISRIDPSTTRGKRSLDMAAPEVKRSGISPKPLLLADRADYSFGMTSDLQGQERVDRVHAKYRDPWGGKMSRGPLVLEPDPLSRTPRPEATMSPREESWMPRAYPPEFRRRAVELARLREKPIARIAADLGIAGS